MTNLNEIITKAVQHANQAFIDEDQHIEFEIEHYDDINKYSVSEYVTDLEALKLAVKEAMNDENYVHAQINVNVRNNDDEIIDNLGCATIIK